MATSWKSQQGNGEYRLQFETDNEEEYKLVEKAAQMAMDGKTKADFAEVVRCFNCAFYDIEDYNCREFDCNMPCDGYCSKGTPKERGGEK